MKYLTILIFLLSTVSFAKETSNPMDLINKFVKPLQEEGLKGLNKAMEEADLDLNPHYVEAAKKAGKDVPSTKELKDSMRHNLSMHGKVLKIGNVEESSRLKGHMKKYIVEIEFFSGEIKKIEFQFIRPTNDGPYKLYQAKFQN